MTISNLKILELFRKIKSLGLFTNSDTHDKVREKLVEAPEGVDGAKFIATTGEPKGTKECSHCRKVLPEDQFKYFQTRVKSDGSLMRSNALCDDCSTRINAERKAALKQQSDAIPPKPATGSICPNCNREWTGNWHRDHDYETNEFRHWLCGNCNMAKQDRRTPNPKA